MPTTHKTPPVAARRPVVRTLHGRRWEDPYAWLRAENWQSIMRDPDRLPADIRNYLEAENTYADAMLEPTAELQKTLVAEMRGRIQEDDSSLPEFDGPYAYLERYAEGDEYASVVRTQRDGSDARVLLDANTEAVGHDYFDFGGSEHSPDHRWLAWAADIEGAEYYRVHFRDTTTGLDAADGLTDVDSFTWSDSSTLYYTRVDEHHRPSRVFRHTLGQPVASDVQIYHEVDTRFHVSVYQSRSGAYVFVSIATDDMSEVHYLKCDDPDTTLQVIEPRRDAHEYEVDHQEGHFIILTNTDNATDFKLVRTPVVSPGIVHWQDLIPHRPGCLLLTFDVLRDWVLWMEREAALPRLCYQSTTGDTQIVDMPDVAYSLGLDVGLEYVASACRFDYSSPRQPEQTWSLDLPTGARQLLKEQRIPSGHDTDDYVVRREHAPSSGGVHVPVTLLHHRDTKLDGHAPCLVYAYGAYGSSIPADFSSEWLSLVDRGMVVATAHVRGGQECGRGWYDSARGVGKTNSMDDVIAVTEWLGQSAMVDPQRLILHGASAGGLLVGAVLNRQPELYAAAIAEVPFVDAINTLVDDSLPLTPGEWAQWGNPLASMADFDAIMAWSPYDNVGDYRYPTLLVTAGLTDPRVTYWEPAKWVAKLRATRVDKDVAEQPLLFRINLDSGHFGEPGRFRELLDQARVFAFALTAVAPEKG